MNASRSPRARKADEFERTVRRAREARALTRWKGWRLVRRYRRARRLARDGDADRAFRLYVRLERRLQRLLAADGQLTPWAGMLLAEVHGGMGSLLKARGFDGEAEGVAALREAVRDLVGLGELEGPSARQLEEKLYASARALLRGRPRRAAASLEEFLRIVRGLGDGGHLAGPDAASLRDEAGQLGAAIVGRIQG